MSTNRMLTVLMLLAILLGASGCKLRKKTIPAAQAQAPTIKPTQTATTQPGPPPPATGEPARPLPTPGEVIVADATPPKDIPKPRPAPKKVPPKKTVVENEPPPPAQVQQQPGQLTASNSQNDSARQKTDTAQLIETIETELRSINRPLNSNEQTMVQHIRSFIKDSQNATANRDYEMAYKLAVKAHLLSDELAKK
jgi:protein TonB